MGIDYSFFTTTQSGPATTLGSIIDRHARSTFLKPIADHQRKAYSRLEAFVCQEKRPIIIDSCCGTGLSTSILAERFPTHWVIGIDKSEARLSRHNPSMLGNYMLLWANVIDQWQLIMEARLPVSHHFLFFPNPWPKKEHLKRRFHAHPIFSSMAKLSPYFELRTNWQIYAEECALAFQHIGRKTIVEPKNDSHYYSLFEKKYLETSCPVFIVKSFI
jgi:tRNA (guanine-N7-)-methyltransferase